MTRIISIPRKRLRSDPEVARWRSRMNVPIPVMPPTTSDWQLGASFILACEELDIDWELFIHEKLPVELRELKPEMEDGRRPSAEHRDSSSTLGELYDEAMNVVQEYTNRFGPSIDDGSICVRDSCLNPAPEKTWLRQRNVQLGDVVETVRKSTDILDDLYEEPREYRSSTPEQPDARNAESFGNRIPISDQRYDGDARWEPDSYEREVWSSPKERFRSIRTNSDDPRDSWRKMRPVQQFLYDRWTWWSGLFDFFGEGEKRYWYQPYLPEEERSYRTTDPELSGYKVDPLTGR